MKLKFVFVLFDSTLVDDVLSTVLLLVEFDVLCDALLTVLFEVLTPVLAELLTL